MEWQDIQNSGFTITSQSYAEIIPFMMLGWANQLAALFCRIDADTGGYGEANSDVGLIASNIARLV